MFNRDTGGRQISAAALLTATCAGTCLAVPNPEFEPNNTKSSATVADSGGPGMAAGDTISGSTTGTTTSTPGDGSADYFLVRMAQSSLGIYRHRFTLTTSGTVGHTGTIRGLTQNGSGVIQADTDLIAQFSSSTTTPARFNQWYGFGKQEDLFYRVTGAGTTTSPYTATLSTDPLTPLAIASPLVSGTITITTSPTDPQLDTAIWVYDGNLDPIPGYSNDNPASPSTSTIASLTRIYTPGTYYVACSSRFLSNNLGSPADERSRSIPVLDFPGAILNSASTAGTLNNIPLTLTHTGGTASITGTRGPYEVVWVRFQVASPVQPTPIAITVQPLTIVKRPDPIAPAPYTGLLTALIGPGDTPISTGIAVSANTAVLGGGAVTMTDDGIPPDAIANDNIWSGVLDASAAAAGIYSVPVTATDAQGRTTIRNAQVTVREGVLPLGTLASGSTLVGTGAVEPRTTQWFSFTPLFAGARPTGYLDMATLAVPGSPISDTVMAMFDASGVLIASDNDDGDGFYSALSFGRALPVRPAQGDGLQFNGRDGRDLPLLADELYYIVVCQVRATITSGFFTTTTGLGSGQVRVAITGRTAAVWCQADLTNDSTVDGNDFIAFINSFSTGDPIVDARADLVGGDDDGQPGGGPDGTIDGSDFVAFINAFSAGC